MPNDDFLQVRDKLKQLIKKYNKMKNGDLTKDDEIQELIKEIQKYKNEFLYFKKELENIDNESESESDTESDTESESDKEEKPAPKKKPMAKIESESESESDKEEYKKIKDTIPVMKKRGRPAKPKEDKPVKTGKVGRPAKKKVEIESDTESESDSDDDELTEEDKLKLKYRNTMHKITVLNDQIEYLRGIKQESRDQEKEKKKLEKEIKEIKEQAKKLKGSGFFDTIKNIVTAPFRTIKGRLTKNSQDVIDKYGSQKIFKILVFRKPLNSILKNAIKVISLGTFNPEKEGYDKLYHLGLSVHLENGVNIKMEKNDAVDISVGDPTDSELLAVPMHQQMTLKQFYDNGLAKMGEERFFQYSGLKYNCQDWIKGMLEGSNLYTPAINKFAFQDMENVRKNINPTSEKIMNTITDTANIARKWLGQGKPHDIGQKLGKHINKKYKHLSQEEKHKLFKNVIEHLKENS